MSGIIKGIGKAFKKVGKVVKKYALPALAIGAVVLTGGAALGVLPAAASMGGIASSLGLSSGLSAVLTSAARAATFGAVGSALTGGNPIKGATRGFMIGGALGGIGAMTQGAGGPMSAGANATADATGTLPGTGAQIGLPTAQAAAEASSMPLDQAMSWAPSGGFPAAAQGGGLGIGSALTRAGGGALDFLNKNPIVSGSLIQGIGAGMMASAQAKEERRQREEEAASYNTDPNSLFSIGGAQQQAFAPGASTPLPYANAKYVYDKNSGKVRLVQGG